MIKDRLKQALEEQKLTQRSLAQKAGITESAISRYVIGRRKANEYSIIKICKALNVSADWLLGLDEEKDEPVKYGYWIKRGENLYECSKCEAWVTTSKYIPIGLHKFCRGCGARMDGGDDD